MTLENVLGIAGRGSKILLLCLFGLIFGCSAPGSANDLLAGRRPSTATFANAPERATDSVVAVVGDAWDTELTTLLEAGGGLEWDLGAEHRLTHAMIAADHDDAYALLVSSDAQRWSQIWEAPRVEAPGQQRRVTSSLNARGRFVRLEPRGGDGAYSVSELAVASEPRGEFPPRFEEKRGKVLRDSRRTPMLWPIAIAIAIAAFAFLPRFGRLKKKLPASPLVSRLDDRLLWITLTAALLLVGTALAYTAEYRFRVIDDSYISFQYAKNLASGNGLVFNPGERVEGFTNFLWIIVMTPIWWISGADPELFTRWVFGVTIGLALAGLALTETIGRRLFLKAWLPTALAVLLVGFDDSIVAYSILGLENHLLIVLMLIGVWIATARPKHWEVALGVSFALVGMTRPDGLLWAGTYFIANVVTLLPRFQDAEDRVPLRSLLRVGVSFVALFGVYFACRYAYYGYPVPNTFYLKVGATLAGVGRGLKYLFAFVTDRYGVPVLALGGLLLWRAAWARWLLLHALLHAAYVVYVGGDFYPGNRFLFVLVPTLALLIGGVFRHFLPRESSSHKRQRRPSLLIPVSAAAACVAVRLGTIEHGAYPNEVRTWVNTVDNNVRYMQWLDTVRRPGGSLVLGDIGAAGFFANLRVLDVYGIVDPKVAHKQVTGFGTGKAGHEKVATGPDLMAGKATYMKWGYIDARYVTGDYYIFNDFPPSLRVEALWVRDDQERGQLVAGTAFHLDARELESWTRTGSAFVAAGSDRPPRGQNMIRGQRRGFVNSFTASEGDSATGRLVSPDFTIQGDRMRLLVGGGRDPERLRVSLLVDGQIVFSATGNNFETLGRREWDLHGLKGKTARIEIVDEAIGTWGHLLVDEIEQWTGARPAKL
jgi:hypothetical protein